MANHPLNLTLRFALELTGLWALGYWGWTAHTGWLRWLLALGAPLLAAVLWGTFRVPGYPGRAPVSVPGAVRLLLEAAFFGTAVWALWTAGRPTWAWVLAAVVAMHYAASYDYVLKLLRPPAGGR